MAEALLLIDDDADGLRVIGDHFERVGYDVAREATGESGLEAYERLRPDVVILDLQLPSAVGLDILERLRALGAFVILLAGQGDIGIAVRAMQLGAENVLMKPVDMDHLAAATARVAEKVRLSRENSRLRALIFSQGAPATGADPLRADPGKGTGRGDRRHAPLTLADVQRRQIERALRFHGGNRTRAAQELGISRATLINKIKAYGLDL